MDQLSLRHELSEPPDRDEILRALGKLTLGRAGGMNGLLPDVLKCCGGPLLDYILTLFQTEVCALRVARCSASPCAQERRFVLL